MGSITGYADVLKTNPTALAYVIVYGGTNIYWIQLSRAKHELPIRAIDSASYVSRLGADVRAHLLANGIDRARIVMLDGGYRDDSATVEMWIIPQGGKRPHPTPNYFPGAARLHSH
jgi:hypothetical protein